MDMMAPSPAVTAMLGKLGSGAAPEMASLSRLGVSPGARSEIIDAMVGNGANIASRLGTDYRIGLGRLNANLGNSVYAANQGFMQQQAGLMNSLNNWQNNMNFNQLQANLANRGAQQSSVMGQISPILQTLFSGAM